jgi:hypothetical protein
VTTRPLAEGSVSDYLTTASESDPADLTARKRSQLTDTGQSLVNGCNQDISCEVVASGELGA